MDERSIIQAVAAGRPAGEASSWAGRCTMWMEICLILATDAGHQPALVWSMQPRRRRLSTHCVYAELAYRDGANPTRQTDGRTDGQLAVPGFISMH